MTQKEQWSIEEFCDTLNQIAGIDKDNIIAVDGKTGAGKSTLAVKLCIYGCPWFDMKKDILYGRKELIEWASSARPGSWGLGDEAINALFKRDFQRGDQKFFIKVLDMCRDRNLTLFLCIPNFWSLDKHVLESRIRLRIHVASTGMAFLWKPTANPFTPDVWYRKHNEKVCYNWDSYPNARRTRGFIGYIKFGDLGVNQKQTYLEVKARKKAEIKAAEEAEENEQELLKKRSVETGKWMMLHYLEQEGMIRERWHDCVARYFAITKQAVIARMKKFRQMGYVELEKSNIKGNENRLYNINDNTSEFDEIKEEFNNIP